jgi:hypothetical protein
MGGRIFVRPLRPRTLTEIEQNRNMIEDAPGWVVKSETNVRSSDIKTTYSSHSVEKKEVVRKRPMKKYKSERPAIITKKRKSNCWAKPNNFI